MLNIHALKLGPTMLLAFNKRFPSLKINFTSFIICMQQEEE